MLDEDALVAPPSPPRSRIPWILATIFAIVATVALIGWWRATH